MLCKFVAALHKQCAIIGFIAGRAGDSMTIWLGNITRPTVGVICRQFLAACAIGAILIIVVVYGYKLVCTMGFSFPVGPKGD